MKEGGYLFFFIRGLYNSPRTFVGPPRDLRDSFYKLLFIFGRLLVLIFFAIFRVKMIKLRRAYYFMNDMVAK